MPKIDLDASNRPTALAIRRRSTSRSPGAGSARSAQLPGLTELRARDMSSLEPGAWSSQRHWHEGEDELLVMLSGRAVLIEDDGETDVRPGRHRSRGRRASAMAIT